jgi:hypothetical protein
MKIIIIRAGTAGLLLALSFLSMCVASNPLQDSSDTALEGWIPSAQGQIQYLYGWSTDRIVFNEDASGWQVETDLGYAVSVNRGYLVSYQMQIVPCADATGTEETIGWIERVFSVQVARAAHSEEFNPAAIYTSYVESLSDPRELDAGIREGSDESFCQSHYLIARAENETVSLPEDLTMVDRSLYIEGTWRAPGSAEDIPFIVDTSSAWGALNNLFGPDEYNMEGREIEVNPTDGSVLVLVKRDLGALFDGIDFMALSEAQLVTHLLKSIFAGIEISIHHEAAPSVDDTQ